MSDASTAPEFAVQVTAVSSLKGLWQHVSKRRRWRLVLLLNSMVIGAILEVLVLGAVVPFIAVIVNGASGHGGASKYGVLARAMQAVPWLPTSASGWATVLVVVIAFSAIFRIVLSKSVLKFAFGFGHELSTQIYRNALYQPYLQHIQSNSSQLLSVIDKCNAAIFNVILPLLNMAVSTVISCAIILGLVLVDVTTALTAAAIFSTIYFISLLFTDSACYLNRSYTTKDFTTRAGFSTYF